MTDERKEHLDKLVAEMYLAFEQLYMHTKENGTKPNQIYYNAFFEVDGIQYAISCCEKDGQAYLDPTGIVTSDISIYDINLNAN